MRYPLRMYANAALTGCLLALLAAGSRSGPASAPAAPEARHQPALSITPPPAASATVWQGSAILMSRSTPAPAFMGTPSAPRTTITPEFGVKRRLEALQDARQEPPLAFDKSDARPPRRAVSSLRSMLHQVETGDTVYYLAAQYGVSWEAILTANNLDEQSARSLDIGQELVIPVGPGGAEDQRVQPAPRVVHEVQAGEALIVIAQDYGTTVESIVAANELVDAESILAGQELIVPVPPDSKLPAPAEPVSGTELLTQTNALAAEPQLAPAEPVSPTLALTQPLVMTETVMADTALELNATNPISTAELLAETSAVTETIATEPVTGTVEIEEALATEPLTDTNQTEAGPEGELAVLEAAMVEAVNAERAAHGLAAYRADEVLTAVARAHAQDMAARDYVGHTSPEGERVRDRLRDAGLDLDRAGENYYVSTRPLDEAVAHTLSWFMGDPPHRDNLLHDHYTRIGVGVAYKLPGWYIFVLDFAGD